MRRVDENGRVTVAGRRLRVGRTYAGQTVLDAKSYDQQPDSHTV